MGTFCNRQFTVLLLLGALALLLVSGGCSRKPSDAAAEKFYTDALTAIHQDRLGDGERLLDAARVLFRQGNNAERYADVTVVLAGLEQMRGKLSHSVLHLNEALAFYRQTQNTARMAPVMNSLADLLALTGSRDSASLLAAQSLQAGALAGSDALKAAAEFERGRIDLIFNDPSAAVAHFTAASAYPSSLANPLFSFESALYDAAALTTLDRNDEAVQKLSEAEHFASAAGSATVTIRLKCAEGALHLRLGMYENAMRDFSEGLKIDSLNGESGMTAQFLAGIGEVYLANYAHESARKYFSMAYAHAQAAENPAVMGYCLLRMADCVAQAAMPSPTGSAVMRAVAFYEKAFALFEHDAQPQRKAVALMKEAVLRSALHEDADADRLFRRAFDLMRTAAVCTPVYAEPWEITTEMRLLPPTVSPVDWWYRPYAAFLLHKRRIGDALAVMCDGMAATQRPDLLRYPLEFQDSTKNGTIREYTSLARTASIAEYELLMQQRLPHASVDDVEQLSTRDAYDAMHDELLSDGAAIAARYPSLLPLVAAPALSIETIQKRASGDASLLSFLSLEDRLYAVIITQKSGLVAVDLGRASTLTDKISSFCAQLRMLLKRPVEARGDPGDIRRASIELASRLVQPIERYITHRLIVHATPEIGDLPLHALLMPNGRPVSDAYRVSYAPFLGAAAFASDLPPIRNVIIVGAPSGRQLEAEYALRSIKNFYRDVSVLATRSATEKNFLLASGDLLHLSTMYGVDTDTQRGTFALSGGTLTSPEAYLPISSFLTARPFRAWLIADQRPDTCGIGMTHAAFALMSGATQLVLQRYPASALVSKAFNENFYAALAENGDAKQSYWEALKQMEGDRGGNAAFNGVPYFLIEW